MRTTGLNNHRTRRRNVARSITTPARTPPAGSGLVSSRGLMLVPALVIDRPGLTIPT